MKTEHLIQAHTGDWVGFRRDIHAHPELRFEEVRTSQRIAEQLQRWGIETHTGIGKTGVVGIVRGQARADGHASMIGLRADMDALPIQEANRFGHASTIAGRMHACGHDGHVAMLMGAAQVLQQNTDHFQGDVALIFQPAEEGGAGALRMIEDGLFERFPIDAVFAMHNWPGLEVGTFAVREGPMMGSSNEFELKVIGKGAHAAMPNLGIDPVVIACQIVQAFQNIVSRVRDPLEPAVISVTQINAGDVINVIPEYATLAGTVRTFSLEVLDLIETHMKQISDSICAGFGARCEFHFQRNYPPVINDRNATRFFAEVLRKLPGVKAVHDHLNPTMGAEDFAFMLQHKPGSYVWIGNGDGDHRAGGHGLGPCMLHNPSYDFNDGLIPLGVRAWVELVHAWGQSPNPTSSRSAI